MDVQHEVSAALFFFYYNAMMIILNDMFFMQVPNTTGENFAS